MVFNPSDGMRLAMDEIATRSMSLFKHNMDKLGKTLEQFDVVRDQPDSPERRQVMQDIKDRTEDLMYFIHTLDALTNNLPDRNRFTNAELHDAFDVIHEIRRLITIRNNSHDTNTI